MKLVELLTRELDVWPDGAEVATQDGGGVVCFSRGPLPVFGAKYDDEWSFDQSGAIDCGGRLSLLLATDHATAIITRADWQAERERIAGGWIAWGGGECPVADDGDGYDVKFSSGEVELGPFPRWYHTGFRDIIAYRLHKPEQQQPQQEQEEMTPCEKLGYKVGDRFKMIDPTHGGYVGQIAELYYDDGTHEPKFKTSPCTFNCCDGEPGAYYSLDRFVKIDDSESAATVSSDDPRTMRNRILEIDRNTEALEEERVQLVQRLADEGFVLARVDGKVAPGQPEEWRVGDLLEITGEEEGHEFGIGSIVRIEEIDHEDDELPYNCRSVSGGSLWYVNSNEAKFHSRPTA